MLVIQVCNDGDKACVGTTQCKKRLLLRKAGIGLLQAVNRHKLMGKGRKTLQQNERVMAPYDKLEKKEQQPALL